jgi:hypothetical protein
VINCGEFVMFCFGVISTRGGALENAFAFIFHVRPGASQIVFSSQSRGRSLGQSENMVAAFSGILVLRHLIARFVSQAAHFSCEISEFYLNNSLNVTLDYTYE